MGIYFSALIFLATLAAVGFAGGLFLKWRWPILSGRSGESYVSKLMNGLDPSKYVVLDDLMLPSNGNWNTTQVDHVVVSNFGVFAIETKNLAGWIFGNAYQNHWTQVIYRYHKKFYNPLRQNFGHVKALEAIVRPISTNIPIQNMIVFPTAEKLQITGSDCVGNTHEIFWKIRSYTKEFISVEQRTKIVEVLRSKNIVDKVERKNHNAAIREIKIAKGF